MIYIFCILFRSHAIIDIFSRERNNVIYFFLCIISQCHQKGAPLTDEIIYIIGSVRGNLGLNCAHLTTIMKICTLLVLDLLISNLPEPKPFHKGDAVFDNSKWPPPQNNYLITSQPKSQTYNYKKGMLYFYRKGF